MNTNVKTELAAVAATQSAVDAMAVVTLSPEKYAAEVYQPFKSRLVEAIDSVRTIDYDITTTAGMAAAVKCRALFRDMRVAADKERKARKEPITKIGKLLESGFDQVEERITPLEVLFDGDIQAEIERKEVEKAAKIAAERARTEAIQKDIQSIRDIVLSVVGMCSASAEAALAILDEIEPTEERFAEFVGEASVAIVDSMDKVRDMLAKAKASEATALAAEEARKAEAKRAADEAAAVAAQRAENERVANEHAATAKRLADQEAAQALAAKQLADKAAANLRAEQDALAEQVRIQREAAAEAQRKLDAQQAEIDAKRAAFVREQEEAAARAEDDLAAAVQHEIDRQAAEILRQQIPVDHAEGLEMNAALDAAIARIEPVEKFATADLARCNATVASLLADNLPPPESCCARDARIDAGVVEVSGHDIIKAVMREFDWSYDEAEKKMKAIDYAAAWQERLAEMED